MSGLGADSASAAPVAVAPRVDLRPGMDAAAHVRIAAVLAVAGALSVALLFPYLLALLPGLRTRMILPLPLVVAAQALQGGVLMFLLAWLGLWLGCPRGLDAPRLRRVLTGIAVAAEKPSWALAVLLGIGSALAVIAIDLLLHFSGLLAHRGAAAGSTNWWQGLLASFYGAIGEEVQCRLFLVSFFVWAAARLLRQSQPSGSVYWLAIVLAALLFGAGHLPTLARTGAFSALGVARVVVLNSLCGIAFGWLFWRRGLEHEMLAHFCADLVLHVAAPLA